MGHQVDFAPISGNQRQAPFKPKTERLATKYEVPYVTTTRGDYKGHSGLHRSADFAPARAYEPSTTPFTKESSYGTTYRALPSAKRDDMPWADAAKRLTNLYTKETDKTNPSCYATDFQQKGSAKRDPIKPERFTWTDRPKFDVSSLYQVKFTKLYLSLESSSRIRCQIIYSILSYFVYTFSNNSLEKLVNRQLATNQLMPIVSQVKRSMDYQQRWNLIEVILFSHPNHSNLPTQKSVGMRRWRNRQNMGIGSTRYHSQHFISFCNHGEHKKIHFIPINIYFRLK